MMCREGGIGLERVCYKDILGSRVKDGFFFYARSPPEREILAGCKKIGGKGDRYEKENQYEIFKKA